MNGSTINMSTINMSTINAPSILRRLIVALGAVIGLVAFASPAAAVYPPGNGPVITTDRQIYPPGVPAVITVHACTPGATVTVIVQQAYGADPLVLTATANGSGDATFTLNNPPVGVSTIIASCGGPPANAQFTVLPEVPVTGADTRSPLGVATVLVIVGCGLLFVARSRRHQPNPQTA
jgi:hypothetical protein